MIVPDLIKAVEAGQEKARVKGGCDCWCNNPVATTPEGMLRFLANRFEHAGVADSVEEYYGA